MTYASPLHNQDGVSRNLALSEQENNRAHKEVSDEELARQKKLEEDSNKDQKVNDLQEQEALDPEGDSPERERQEAERRAQEAKTQDSGPPAHLGGGEFVDFSA